MKKFIKNLTILPLLLSCFSAFAGYKDIKPLVDFLNTKESPKTTEEFCTERNIYDLTRNKLISRDSDEYNPNNRLEQLNAKAKALSEMYLTGVYCFLVDDMYRVPIKEKHFQIPPERTDLLRIENNIRSVSRGYDSADDILVLSDNLFLDYNLGFPETRETIMLVLDVNNRTYDIFLYGKNTNRLFTEKARENISHWFLKDIADGKNNWYEAFNTFLHKVEDFEYKYLTEGNSTPEDISEYFEDSEDYQENKNYFWHILVAVVLGLIIGFGVCSAEKSKLCNIKTASGAGDYIPEGAIKFTVREDIFTHSTERREKIENSSSESSHYSSSSGGSSHSSGHF